MHSYKCTSNLRFVLKWPLPDELRIRPTELEYCLVNVCKNLNFFWHYQYSFYQFVDIKFSTFCNDKKKQHIIGKVLLKFKIISNRRFSNSFTIKVLISEILSHFLSRHNVGRIFNKVKRCRLCYRRPTILCHWRRHRGVIAVQSTLPVTRFD